MITRSQLASYLIANSMVEIEPGIFATKDIPCQIIYALEEDYVMAIIPQGCNTFKYFFSYAKSFMDVDHPHLIEL